MGRMNDRANVASRIADVEAQRRVLTALEAELTPDLRRSLLEFARKREGMLVAYGVRGALGEASSYVADAIGDTLLGEVTWTEGTPLAVHLHGVIRGRTAWTRRRARIAPHVSVDDPSKGAATRGEMIAAAGMAPDTAAAYEAAEETTQVVEYLEAVAADDPLVLALLGAYRAGAQGVAEVAESTGMTPAEVGAARKRMDRLLLRMTTVADRDLSDSGSW